MAIGRPWIVASDLDANLLRPSYDERVKEAAAEVAQIIEKAPPGSKITVEKLHSGHPTVLTLDLHYEPGPQ